MIATKAARGVLATTGGTRRPISISISTISTISTTTEMLMPMRTQRQRYRVTRTTLNATKTRRIGGKGFCLRGGAGNRAVASGSAARNDGNDGTTSSSVVAMMRARKPSQTGQIAKILADTVIRGGDVICLHGGVGAGKSLFARAFIRSVLNEGLNLSVTSPTYLIQNTYENESDDRNSNGVKKVHHFDLYRLPDEKSVKLLIDVEDTFSKTSVAVFEWPDRLGSLIEKAENRVDVFISATTEEEEEAMNDDHDDFKNKFGLVDEAHLLALDDEDDGDGDDDGEDKNDSDDENDLQKRQTMRRIEFRPVGASITERLQESSFRLS